ncbi:hypothetical protein B0H14DRAFT_2627329 [Mycena olivaceomarginata]|nr:hypothetical protein B0H14DRAFT_2627329 [Mycena olivaceomarginata]
MDPRPSSVRVSEGERLQAQPPRLEQLPKLLRRRKRPRRREGPVKNSSKSKGKKKAVVDSEDDDADDASMSNAGSEDSYDSHIDTHGQSTATLSARPAACFSVATEPNYEPDFVEIHAFWSSRDHDDPDAQTSKISKPRSVGQEGGAVMYKMPVNYGSIIFCSFSHSWVVVLFQYNFKLVSEARNLNSIVVIEPWYDSGYWAL